MKGIELQVVTTLPCPKKQDIKKWAQAALTQQQKVGSMVVRIVDEDEIKTLNHHYRNKDKATNVLSFKCNLPENLRGDILGDIVICASVVAFEAKTQGKEFNHHFAHMVVHGVLHLLGYDHEIETEAVVMENHEIAILKELGFSDPYRVEHT